MSSTSTPTRPARGLVVPGIDTHSVFDQKPCLPQQAQSFSGWGPLTPPSSAHDSRRPSLAFSSMSDATHHSGPSSISSFSQPATPVHSMVNSADSFVHQWHETSEMHAALPAQMETACTLTQQQPMCDMSYPHGLPMATQNMSMQMSDSSPMRNEMWQDPQHGSFGPVLQPGLADTLYHSVQNLGQQHAQHASMYANPSASMNASLEQSVFPNVPAVPSFHAQPRVVVPSQLGPQDDYPMDHYPQYDQSGNDFAQSFDSNMTGSSGWESVGPPSPMEHYMNPSEEDYVMVKEEFIKDEFAGTPTKSQVWRDIHYPGSPSASRIQRRPSNRKVRKSQARAKIFSEYDTGICHVKCEGPKFSLVTDQEGKRHVISETPRTVKMNRCTHKKDNGTICNASFDRAEHLKRHMLSHSNVRAFPCPLPSCTKEIGRSDNALDHFMTHLREKSKGKRNHHFSLDKIEEYLRGHHAWDDKKVTKMIEKLHRRMANEMEKARIAAIEKARQEAMAEAYGKQRARL